ncbi:MAG: PD-(D/E)XK nuclease family protein [Gammaproteobacteria bacterium]|nr:PD-(D/E)XK nuclease family protein [Gammaproteobacteria bacterium]
MIDLKRNSKKELVPASGKRVRSSSIYTPNQKKDFKISRGRFSNFLTCPRCFYLDRVVGLDEPGTPGWTLNETTDLLLKQEFDVCRESQVPHRLFIENGLGYLVPFIHPDMDKWRDSLRHGLIHRFEDTNIILTGGVDDIWQDTRDGRLIVVDYKSQANTKSLDAETYLSDAYHEGYKTQMDFYAYLLQQMGFEVTETAYFLVCNADRTAEGFFGEMKFSETLIPYGWNTDWIPGKVSEMVALMNQEEIPDAHPSCKNCAYANQRNLLENPKHN